MSPNFLFDTLCKIILSILLIGDTVLRDGIEKVDTKLRAVRLLFGGAHMKKSKRNKYTDEFKEDAVKLVTDK